MLKELKREEADARLAGEELVVVSVDRNGVLAKIGGKWSNELLSIEGSARQGGSLRYFVQTAPPKPKKDDDAE